MIQYNISEKKPIIPQIRKGTQQTINSAKLWVVELKRNREKERFALYNLFLFELIIMSITFDTGETKTKIKYYKALANLVSTEWYK